MEQPDRTQENYLEVVYELRKQEGLNILSSQSPNHCPREQPF